MYKKVDIISNKKIASDIYFMELDLMCEVKAGQFFMLKPEGSFMTLFRPLSVFDFDRSKLCFLYSVRGKGTEFFSKMLPLSKMEIHGPYGNSWEEPKGKTLLLAGGIGFAPLYKVAKEGGQDFYVGFRENQYDAGELGAIRELLAETELNLVTGGFVTEEPDYSKYEAVYACGPELMYKSLREKHDKIYASFERHMGCGLGACKSCSITAEASHEVRTVISAPAKNFSVCKDGPIFNLRDVHVS